MVLRNFGSFITSNIFACRWPCEFVVSLLSLKFCFMLLNIPWGKGSPLNSTTLLTNNSAWSSFLWVKYQRRDSGTNLNRNLNRLQWRPVLDSECPITYIITATLNESNMILQHCQHVASNNIWWFWIQILVSLEILVIETNLFFDSIWRLRSSFTLG